MAEELEKKITLKLPKFNFWPLVAIICLVVALVTLTGWPLELRRTTGMAVALTSDQAAKECVDYINNNVVQSGNVTLVKVEESSGVYKVTVSYQGREIPVYITKDGLYLFLSQPLNTSQEIPKEPEEQAQGEVPKTDKPEVHAFVMSYCPYGLQFLKAYIPVMELLGNKADLQVNFVSYAMHGKKELDENTRMYCIQKEQGDKFTKYLRCFVQTDDSEKCIVEAGIDKTKLESCIISTDNQFNITGLYNDKSAWSGGTYPPYPVDATLASQYGVGGSPTFVVNVKSVTVDRSPEAIKQIICSAFNNPPEECSQKLSANTEAPGIGSIGSGSGSTSTGGCG